MIKLNYGVAASVLLVAACGSDPIESSPTSASSAGVGGSGGSSVSNAQSSNNSSQANSSSMVASSSTTGMGGNSGMDCDPPAAAGSLYEKSAKIFPLGPDKSMCSYRGEVVLIVNTAAL
ncbi:MAG: hypothetical protein VB934_21475 [Polyangiaceae bacterium]